MIEWCYQGDNPEFIEDHYKGNEAKERQLKGEIGAKLVKNLRQTGFGGINSEEKCDNIGDAKDAEYFLSW